VWLLAAMVAGGGLVGCTAGLQTPRDAIAVFDGGWVSAEELAEVSSGERAGTSRLPGVRGATQEELARWIAWEELVAADRRNEVDGRRDFSLRVHELQQEPLVSRLLADLGAGVQVSDAEVEAELEAIRASRSARSLTSASLPPYERGHTSADDVRRIRAPGRPGARAWAAPRGDAQGRGHRLGAR